MPAFQTTRAVPYRPYVKNEKGTAGQSSKCCVNQTLVIEEKVVRRTNVDFEP